MNNYRIKALPVNIFHSNHEGYLVKRIESSFYNTSLDQNSNEIDFINFSIIQAKELLNQMIYQPKVSTLFNQAVAKNELEALNQYKMGLSALVSKLYPLIEGEEVVKEDTLLYTIQPSDTTPISSLVLKRITNFSEILFIDFNAQLNLKSFEIIRKDLPAVSTPYNFLMENNDIDYTEIARKLADGLTGLAPSPLDKVASFLLEYVWPSADSAKQDWETAFKRINQIIKKALARERVSEAKRVIDGFISFHSTQYVHLRDNKSITKEYRLSQLNQYDHDFYTRIVEQLQSNDNPELAISALANFLIGVNLHFALIQEKGLQSEKEQMEAYKKTIVSLIHKYKKYVLGMKKVMINYRTSFISEIKDSCNGFGAYHYITDNFTEKEVAYCYFDKSTLIDSLEYMRKKRRSIINNLAYAQASNFDKNILPIVQNWDKLIENPIPQKG